MYVVLFYNTSSSDLINWWVGCKTECLKKQSNLDKKKIIIIVYDFSTNSFKLLTSSLWYIQVMNRRRE